MTSDSSSRKNRFDIAIESIAGLLFLMQIILLFYFDNFGLNILIFGIGWLMIIPSFLLLTLPLRSLSNYSNLSDEGKTDDETLVVKKGIYGIVRHPLYVGWMLMSISLILISQSWLSMICALIIVPLILIIISHEDRTNTIRFGEEYSQYQKEVPLVNIFSGIWRYHRRKRVP